MAKSRTPLRIPFVAEVSAAIKSIRGLDKEIDGLDASARKAQESFKQAGDATDQAFDGAQDSVDAAEKAMRSLGIKSEQVANNQIAHLRQAFVQLKTSGAASTKEIERAYQNMQNRIQRINAQIGREGARTFRQLAQDASAQLRKVGDGMSSIGGSLSIRATAPITLGLGAMVREAGNFEQAMGAVQAVMGNLSTKEVDALSAAAEKLGADTKFSATEAANAIEMLGGVGLDATTILNGALDASVKTAAATGGALDETAGMVASIMGQFKLGAEDIKGIGDTLTGFTQASKFNIQEISYAFAAGGSAAVQAGLDVNEFAAAISAIDPLFASGSDAGTSLKAFISGLTPNSKEAITLFEKLNIRVKDARGNFLPLVEIVESLRQGLSRLSEYDQAAALETLFGSDGSRAAAGLVSAGKAGIEAKQRIIEAGDAAKAADQRMAGFNGQLEQLYGALSSLAIAVGKSGILKFLTDLVKGVTEWVNWLAEASPATLKWGTIILALVAAIGPLLLIFGQIAIGAAIATTGIGMLVAALGGITLVGAGLAVGIGLALGAVVAAVIVYREQISNALGDVIRFVTESVAGLAGAVETVAKHAVSQVASVLQGMVQIGAASALGLVGLVANLATAIESVAKHAVSGVLVAFGQLLAVGGHMIASVSQAFWNMGQAVGTVARFIVSVFVHAFTSMATSLKTVFEFSTGIIAQAFAYGGGALASFGRAAYAIIQSIGAALGSVWDAIAGTIGRAVQSVSNAVMSLVNWVMKQLGRLGRAVSSARRAIGFASGGYTGNGGVREVAGVVHGREFVLSAPAVRAYGLGMLESMNRMTYRPAAPMVPAMAAGGGGRNSGLSPVNINLGSETVQLLGDEPNVLKLLNSQARRKSARRTGRPSEW